MPNLDARLSTVLMFTNCFIELIKRVKGGLKKLEAYLILKTIFWRNFYFQRINRFLPEWKFDFQKLRVSFQGTWIPETGKPTSPQLQVQSGEGAFGLELPLLGALDFSPNTAPGGLPYKRESMDTCPGANHLRHVLSSSSRCPLI